MQPTLPAACSPDSVPPRSSGEGLRACGLRACAHGARFSLQGPRRASDARARRHAACLSRDCAAAGEICMFACESGWRTPSPSRECRRLPPAPRCSCRHNTVTSDAMQQQQVTVQRLFVAAASPLGLGARPGHEWPWPLGLNQSRLHINLILGMSRVLLGVTAMPIRAVLPLSSFRRGSLGDFAGRGQWGRPASGLPELL